MKLLHLITMVFTCTSCTSIGTLYPLSENDNELIFKKELLGRWKASPDSMIMDALVDTVPLFNGKVYSIKIIQEDFDTKEIDTSSSFANLIKIKNQYFLDHWNADDKLYHIAVWISFDGKNKLKFTTPDPDELLILIDKKKLPVTCLRIPILPERYPALIIPENSVKHKKALEKSLAFPKLYEDKTIMYKSN